jgi:hypothetical protein
MTSKSMLIEGLTDAVGFVAGALLGYGDGHLLGFNIFDEGYSNGSIFGIVLVGLGGGAGLQAARHWRNRDKSPKGPSES